MEKQLCLFGNKLTKYDHVQFFPYSWSVEVICAIYIIIESVTHFLPLCCCYKCNPFMGIVYDSYGFSGNT